MAAPTPRPTRPPARRPGPPLPRQPTPPPTTSPTRPTVTDGYKVHVSGSGDSFNTTTDDNETINFGDTDNGSESGSNVGADLQSRIEGSNSKGGKGSDTSNVKIDGNIQVKQH